MRHDKRHIDNIKKAYQNTELLEKMSNISKKLWENPEYAKKVSSSIKEAYVKDPNKRIIRGKKLRKYYNSHPEAKENISKKMKKVWENPEYVEKLSIAQKESYTPERIEKVRETVKNRTIEVKHKGWYNLCETNERPEIFRNGEKIGKLCTNDEVILIYQMAQEFKNYLLKYNYPLGKTVVEDRKVPENILTYEQIAEMFNTTRGNVFRYANKLSRKKLLNNW